MSRTLSTTPSAPRQSSTTSAIERLRPLIPVEPSELGALLWSAAYFFFVLSAYYIVRPIREEMGVRLGRDSLSALFTIVFIVMLAAVPLFGWVATRFERRRIVPVVYIFFILNLVVFWALFSNGVDSVVIAGAFFVWVSVFNLFVVSLFWSFMSDLWASGQAKRLYGVIAAGGSAGAICGPLITQSLVQSLGATNLLLVSCALLIGALACVAGLRRAERHAEVRYDEQATQGLSDWIGGAVNVWRSPYMFRIALVVLLANLISTYFYFEQSRIVGLAISEPAARVQLFARMDLAVNILTVLAQVFLTGTLMQRLGVGFAAGALPLTVVVGLIAIAIAPTLPVIVVVVVIERAVAFAITNPAFRVLWTVVEPEDKYKAQNFVDTVVYRGGDAASGWLFNEIAKGLGLSMTAVALLTLPLAAWWLRLAVHLGRDQAERAKSQVGS